MVSHGRSLLAFGRGHGAEAKFFERNGTACAVGIGSGYLDAAGAECELRGVVAVTEDIIGAVGGKCSDLDGNYRVGHLDGIIVGDHGAFFSAEGLVVCVNDGLGARGSEVRNSEHEVSGIQLCGTAVLERDRSDGIAPDVRVADFKGSRHARSCDRNGVLVFKLSHCRLTEPCFLHFEAAAVGNQPGYQALGPGAALMVIFMDDGAVGSGGGSAHIDIAGGIVVDFYRNRGALHYGAEVVPYVAVAVKVGIIYRDVGCDVGIAKVGHAAAPSVCVGTEDEILGITLRVPFGIGYGEVPVVPVVRSGGVVDEFEVQAFSCGNREVIGEVGPPSGAAVFRADDACGYGQIRHRIQRSHPVLLRLDRVNLVQDVLGSIDVEKFCLFTANETRCGNGCDAEGTGKPRNERRFFHAVGLDWLRCSGVYYKMQTFAFLLFNFAKLHFYFR